MARATLTPRARPTPPPAPPAPPSPPATGQSKSGSLQDLFLNYLRKEKISVTMFLVKGVKLQGIVTWFDNFSILLRRDGQSQLVYKHAISTIMPVQQVDVAMFDSHAEGTRKQRLLQDVFLSRVREAEVQVTMFLVNGVMLQGRIASFDQFCMLLERDGYVQLAYKHAVSTIQPATHVELSDDYDEDDGKLIFGNDDIAGEVTRGARALVVCPDIRGQRSGQDPEARLEEARGLAMAIGIVVAESYILPVRTLRPNTLFGEGQVQRMATDCELHEAELVIVDGALSPIQQRNLEDKLKRKVIDRTGLILEIFGERAATAEGRLQVELAHLDYQQSRLVRSWTHLERQRGGFGFLGGPGETQIEADRRMIRARMAKLRRELEQVRKTRELHRKRRGRAPWPVIALVGYTNAGKSTLFNRVTGADVMAEDLLFATLDPTMRAISLPGVEKAILSDTVGFISDLPTQLVAAFRATLEEVTAADIILHVRDMANPDTAMQKAQVMRVLADLGVVAAGDGEGEAIPIVEVWNKWDLLDTEQREELAGVAASDPDVVIISALTGEGIDTLFAHLGERLTKGARLHHFAIPAGEGARIAWLYAHGEVLADVASGNGEARELDVRLSEKDLGRFVAMGH